MIKKNNFIELFNNKFIKMIFFVWVLNFGLAVISFYYGNFSIFFSSKSASMSLLLLLLTSLIVVLHLSRSLPKRFLSGFGFAILILIGIYEISFFLKWKSPSIQILSFIFVFIGVFWLAKKDTSNI